MKLNLGIAIASFTLAVSSFLHPATVQGEGTKPQPQQPTVQQSEPPQQASTKHIKLVVAVSNLSDLKVHQGDRVKVGDTIADRTNERNQLESQRKQETLTLKKLQESTAPVRPQLHQVPGVAPLPPANYSQEITGIESAKVRLAQTERQYQLYQQADPKTLVETAALDLQTVNARQTSEAVLKQTEKIDQLQGVAELPPEVVEHENKALEKLRDSDVKASSELQLKQAEVKASILTAQAKLQQLQDEVGQAQSNLSLAYSKLDKARNERLHLEYQHSIELTRTAIQQNQARTELAKASRDLTESERKRVIDLQQASDRISQLESKLNQLAVYRAPIDGVVKRVKFVEQGTDGLLKIEVVIASTSTGLTQSFPGAAKD